MSANFDEDVNSINPMRLPRDRETAAAIFRYGMLGSFISLGISFVLLLVSSIARGDPIELLAIALVVEGAYALFALWVRQKGTTWPLAIFLALSSVLVVISLSQAWTDLSITHQERLFRTVPDLMMIVGQLLNFRALRFLLENHGSLASMSVPVAPPTTQASTREIATPSLSRPPVPEHEMAVSAPRRARIPILPWLGASVLVTSIVITIAVVRFKPFANEGNSAAPSEAAALAGPPPSQAASSSYFVITDKLLEFPPSWEGLHNLPDPPSYCVGAEIAIGNQTQGNVSLGLDGNDMHAALGTVGPAYELPVKVDLGDWIVTLDKGDESTPLFRFIGRDCTAPIAGPGPQANAAATAFTPDEGRLIKAHADANTACRQSPSDATDHGCRERGVLLAEMNARGICWGRVTEPEALYEAHRCDATSIR
ncbi:hypothetical protein HY78_02120 [Rhizorhabdus wittichii DC-6]|nr:hypothetical protein HY78_02120 [Rhizorhabdus wittichii DC-6]